MKKLRWQLLVVFLALVAIGALLLSQQPKALPGVAGEAPQPTTGGIYIEALTGTLGRLNPLLDYYNPADRDVDRLLFSGLIRFDDRGTPLGDLADSWGISQDGTTYNFSIRANAVWHDGQPVTSDDVVFTAGLMRDDQMPTPADLREFWKQVEVKTIDEKTVQFHLPEPFAPFLDYLTFGVLPKHVLGQIASKDLIASPFNLKPVGSGPFRFDHLAVEGGQIKGVVLTAFDKYYVKKPFFEQVAFQYYPDAAAALSAYHKKEVLGINRIPSDLLPQALKEPNLNIYTGRLPHLSLIYLNQGNGDLPFFQDATIRRALLMGLNRQWMIDHVLGGQAILANGPLLPGTWAYYDGLEKIGFDSAAALALIKQAGYTLPADGSSTIRAKDGISLTFEMVYPDEAPYQTLAESIQNDWKKLGVQVNLKAVPYAKLLSDYLEPRTYQAALVDLNLARSPDPDPYPFWHQTQASGGQNYGKWDDRQASEYLEQARVLVDMAERARLYRNFQVRFVNQMPALPLYYPVYSYGVDNSIQGVSMGPLFDTSDRLNTVSTWYLAAKKPSAAPALKPAPSEAVPAITP
ncbi:MAG TPA: peptide ABC transporter substrate-binding protein [Anaerolineales bacterium]